MKLKDILQSQKATSMVAIASMAVMSAMPVQAQYTTQNQENRHNTPQQDGYVQQDREVFSIPEYARPQTQPQNMDAYRGNGRDFTPPGQSGTIPGCGPSGDRPKKCGEEIPVDGGLGLLALLGVGYAGRKLCQNEE